MKRYVFSLHRVLRVRSAQESAARQALRTAADQAARAADDYDLKMCNYEANVASAASLRGTVLSMLAMRAVSSLRAEAVLEADRQRVQADGELGTASQTWADAKKRLSSLEELDERHRAEHRSELGAEEQRAADDISNGKPRPATAPGEASR